MILEKVHFYKNRLAVATVSSSIVIPMKALLRTMNAAGHYLMHVFCSSVSSPLAHLSAVLLYICQQPSYAHLSAALLHIYQQPSCAHLSAALLHICQQPSLICQQPSCASVSSPPAHLPAALLHICQQPSALLPRPKNRESGDPSGKEGNQCRTSNKARKATTNLSAEHFCTIQFFTVEGRLTVLGSWSCQLS